MTLQASISFLKGFKESAMSVANFMQLKNHYGSKGLGQAGHHDTQFVFNARKGLKTALCNTYIGSISNTDEVAVFYCSFPSRDI